MNILKNAYRWTYLAALAGFAPISSLAQTDQPNHEQTLYSGLMVKTIEWTKTRRDKVSDTWLSTARGIDQWMSGEESQGDNKSRINIGFKQTLKKAGDHESDFYIRGKLDIPNTRRKLKIFIDSETNDQSRLEDKYLNDTERSYSTAGISRLLKSGNFDFSSDIGAKFRIPFDPFYRFKGKYHRTLNPNWQLGFEQKLWYYHRRGWGESSELFFTHPLDDQRNIQISTEVQYQQRYKEFEFGQFIALNQAIPGNHWRSFSFGITGSSQPAPQADSLIFLANYQRLIYEDWLVFSAQPKLRFPKDDNWKPNPEFELRLDIYFQEKRQ